MLPKRKMYIDSRYKTDDSISNADFKIQLSENIKFPENSGFYITDICIPNTFKTVETGINDKLYIRFDIYPESITQFKTITIPPKNYTGYTLATQLEQLFNAAIDTYSIIIWDFKCLYEQNTNTLTITGNLEQGRDLRMAWELYSDDTLKNYKNWTGPPYDPNNLHSFNANIQNLKTQRLTNLKKSYICTSLDLHSIKNIYLSSNMANYENINPEGYPSNIIKRYR